ncbi:zinc-binding alcohol dehydrogenase family protein [Aspergillus alliaceus]|uniref:zinc-binding alcohol dehydrogenase family protein n=1 Tax=Petromyces alliaceus TaxID=209559 RepID=UPI0012A48129|nr:GroES-like protein [Aspergillus alliaceus]KAB8238393.1 GroES-like protein [Aspergillus alliaceus]
MAVSIDLPATQRAIVANDQLDYCIRDDVPLPPLLPDCVIIKTEYVGLNPVDTKMVGPFVKPGASYGIDASGTIVAMGAEVVAAGRLHLGDRIAGAAEGMEGLRPQSGAFAEYVSVDGGMALQMPDGMSFAEGAGAGLRIATASMALFHSLGLPAERLRTALDPKTQEDNSDIEATAAANTVLVYGGATSTGTMAIQLLKRCGMRVITTCSPRNFDLVRSYGADDCFDYRSPTCGADIRASTGNALEYALDCITEESTMKICYQALGRCGGKYVGLEPYPETADSRRTVAPDWILATWMRGLPISWPEPFGTQGKPEAREFARNFFPYIHPLFSAGQLKTHPIREEPDGFEGLLDGVALIRKGQINGQKLVYRTADRRVGTAIQAAA